MNFLARFLRFVVWVLILSWGLKLVGRLFAWAIRRSGAPGPQDGGSRTAEDTQPQLTARQLVRDPVCGMHLAEPLAIPFRDGGVLVHFCSAECREKYASGSLRHAANA